MYLTSSSPYPVPPSPSSDGMEETFRELLDQSEFMDEVHGTADDVIQRNLELKEALYVKRLPWID